MATCELCHYNAKRSAAQYSGQKNRPKASHELVGRLMDGLGVRRLSMKRLLTGGETAS